MNLSMLNIGVGGLLYRHRYCVHILLFDGTVTFLTQVNTTVDLEVVTFKNELL